MKDTVSRAFERARSTFLAFSAGQKAITVLGTVALLIGGFMVFRWASTPDYAPLYSNLSASDASAVVDQLQSDGTPYELTGGGGTIMVPQDQVYATRISLSGDGLPADSDKQGYSILDDQGMSLSQEQQDTNFKRAMEGELATTIEAIDGVQTAVVHLAIPQKQVFSDEQDPTTASVLVETKPGSSLDANQVQAVVNLVASSIDGLDPKNVTVADSSGTVLSSPGGTSASGTGQAQEIADVQDQLRAKLQTMLDRVVGAGNSTVQVTADLDFDNTTTTTTDYTADPANPTLSSSSSSETYNGAGAGSGVPTGGVVGPDGQMETGTGSGSGSSSGDGSYQNSSTTQDNAIDTKVEQRVSAPGSLSTLHVGVALDQNALTLAGISPATIKQLVTATAGIDKARGDTVAINAVSFDRTAEKAAAKELAAADQAADAARRQQQYKEMALAGLIGLMVLGAIGAARRRGKKREEATTYLVEQLRADQESRVTATQIIEPTPELAMADAGAVRGRQLKGEIDELISRQPDDVAALLRGWLAERP